MKSLFSLFLLFCASIVFAQQVNLSGSVKDNTNNPLPGVNIFIKGTKKASVTDFDGNYQIQAQKGDILIFSFVGMKQKAITVADNTTLNVILEEDSAALSEVVVTALGIGREKKALGYATQKLKGAAVSEIKDANFVNSLSGKVSGVQIQSSGTMGGSANVIMRGTSSITGNNQALFVVDGVLINNDNNNSSNQRTGRGGYDYGNAAMDINPDNIESISVLRGAAASVLYGSRASNGVIMITTKKGRAAKGGGLGVSFSSSFTVGQINPNTFVKYQNQYGAGYGEYYSSPDKYFEYEDIKGKGNKELVVPSGEDASFGAKFDPKKMVYQWNSFYPELKDTYKKPTPWVAAQNTPEKFYEISTTAINTVSFGNSTEKTNYLLSYTLFDQKGILPNSSIKKNIINLSAGTNLSKKLNLSSKITYSNIRAMGRYGTGYDGLNPNQSFRQWFQTNVDILEQKDAYLNHKKNITWNTKGWDSKNKIFNNRPKYMNNPYWVRYENYQNDVTNRVFGNVVLKYQFTDWLDLMGRVGMDHYKRTEEERMAVGSLDPSRYARRERGVTDMNYDFFLNLNKNLTEDLNVFATLGSSIFRNRRDAFVASTLGGLVVPRLYALSNGKSLPNNPSETEQIWGRNAFFGTASVGYQDTYFLEGSYRYEKASTLPKDNNTFGYFGVSGSFVFSELLPLDLKDIISFGKLRGGYSTVGNAAGVYALEDTYNSRGSIDGNKLFSAWSTARNPDLRDELSSEIEAGLEMKFLENRLGFEVSFYNRQSIDQIMASSVTTATGYGAKYVNAGKITNQGVELTLNANPIKTTDFSWDITLNWTRNRNKVVDLFGNVEEIQLASVQGGVSINATKGEPYGTIKGYDHIYHNGEKVVGEDGYYKKTKDKVVLGDVNPDWIGGITNQLRYKNFNMSFFIDIKKGGSLFSLDTWYGYATGVYDRTAFINDLGNPVRNSLYAKNPDYDPNLKEGKNTGKYLDGGGPKGDKRETIDNKYKGGVILDGVKEVIKIKKEMKDGKEIEKSVRTGKYVKNDKRVAASNYRNPWGYKNAVHKEHVYDASFVKLREVSLGYTFPESITKELKLSALSLSLIGRNLWIIHKNTPYADPEAGLSSGNVQGYQSGSYPGVRELGLSLNVKF